MQIRTLLHAKFPSRGQLIDFFIKALGIENVNDADRKRYQKFVKEYEITTEEYHETLNIYIEQILEEFAIENAKMSSAKKIVENCLNNYLELVQEVEIYPYTQECITYILTKYFYLPCLNFFSEHYLNINIGIFSDSDQDPLKDLFYLFKNQIGMDDKEFIQYLFTELDCLTDKSKGDKTLKQSIQNWVDAKVFPNMKNIEHLAKIFSKKLSISEYEIKQYFLVAKLINRSELPKEFIFGKNSNFVTIDKFQELTREYCEPQYDDILGLASKLYKFSCIKTEKTNESEKEFNDVFKKITEQGYTAENMPYVAWAKARFYAQKKEFKEATDYYVLALENGKNSMGKHYIDIVKEGLIVSAHTTRKEKLDLTNAKSPFVKFYKEAYFLKLINFLPAEINQYFLNDMKKKFSLYFTELYPSIKKTTKGEFKPYDNGIIYKSDIDNIKLDLKKPDKCIKDKFTNPKTQLMHFACFGKYNDVKKLIDAGANVNKMRFNDNGTALTMVLSNEFMGKKRDEAIKIAKLLISKMSEEALCAKLPKKKMTALGFAIDLGYVEIVKLLIEKGADINQVIKYEDVSPLYYTVSKIGNANKDPSALNSLDVLNDSEILEMVNSQLSTLPMFRNAITDKEKIESYKNSQRLIDSSPGNKELKNHILNFYREQSRRHIEEYYQIFELLLNAHPNLELRFKGNLNTILMLATELNQAELVKRLLDAGADKNATIDDIINPTIKHTAKAYAIKNNNKELMSLL